MIYVSYGYVFFFFNDTATTEIYTLSLHDALPISFELVFPVDQFLERLPDEADLERGTSFAENAVAKARYFAKRDRKSTRLNSSHGYISYAVFCLKKKKYQSNEVRRVIHLHIPYCV